MVKSFSNCRIWYSSCCYLCPLVPRGSVLMSIRSCTTAQINTGSLLLVPKKKKKREKKENHALSCSFWTMIRAGGSHRVQHPILWESSSVTNSERCAGNTATGPVWYTAAGHLFPRVHGGTWHRGDKCDRLQRRRMRKDGCSSPSDTNGYVVFLARVQYIHSFRAWMGVINLNYQRRF